DLRYSPFPLTSRHLPRITRAEQGVEVALAALFGDAGNLGVEQVFVGSALLAVENAEGARQVFLPEHARNDVRQFDARFVVDEAVVHRPGTLLQVDRLEAEPVEADAAPAAVVDERLAVLHEEGALGLGFLLREGKEGAVVEDVAV